MIFGQKTHFIANKSIFLKCSAFSLQLNAENRFKIRTACNQIHVFQLFFIGLIWKRPIAKLEYMLNYPNCSEDISLSLNSDKTDLLLQNTI